jgi:hypothetical protein
MREDREEPVVHLMARVVLQLVVVPPETLAKDLTVAHPVFEQRQ